MDYVANRETQIKQMLKEIGIDDISALFTAIPSGIQLPTPKEDDGMSEYEGMRHMEELAARNTFAQFDNYLGAGSYEHHVPPFVSAICGKSEFLTAYTPYQPEASQGMLQTIFEFQSAVCALTGMDVSNASVYDGASACAEGVLMAMRAQKKRRKVLIAETLNPHYRGVVDLYLDSQDVDLVTVSMNADGTLDEEVLERELDDQTVCLLLQYPNFLGVVDRIAPIANRLKEAGALLILCANPLAYGLYQSAGELGADIAVGDMQPIGLPMQFGGPYAGYVSCTQALVRQMPGRIVGETVDTKGRRGFVLTLQAREQHIRREKATSNICTNQALAALASLVAILWYGPEGIKKLARANFQRAAYLKQKLLAIPGVSAFSDSPHFNEFVVKIEQPLDDFFKKCRANKIEPGLDLGRYFPKLSQHVLICATETKSKSQLDKLSEVLHHG
jgi:glycine dehydrogenase subunit 1